MNPCQFSPEVLEVVKDLIQPGEHIFDPFAGHGLRLAALCEQTGANFAGIDIEVWEPHDDRVSQGDATDAASYPWRRFTVVTSPTYVNKRCADYANGPTPHTKVKGRRDYGIALGRALHPGNLARHTGRPSRAAAYWRLHALAVAHWDHRVILNVDLPISDPWQVLLIKAGYEIKQVLPAYTQRYGGLHNAEKRAEYEVVIEARKA